jgi:AcrR family transcriptional regulator
MADVAREMGVSHGTLYNYVESKEALFYLLVERGVSDEPVKLPDQLPLPTPSQETLLRRLEEQMRHTFVLPELDRALKRRRVSDARDAPGGGRDRTLGPGPAGVLRALLPQATKKPL